MRSCNKVSFMCRHRMPARRARSSSDNVLLRRPEAVRKVLLPALVAEDLCSPHAWLYSFAQQLL